ncbi:helix-turn-helix transcriptional regulator [Rossellomorea vietnamensis]|uniref:Helix-turn-helix transcriptional regulator n=2 Tax=Bacillaceae TaxID=186817 RepID=A0A5D4M773_9BACI|nr:helix-turn-helix transcriptional regulator [Rossellomorea vietnamensis]
MKTAGESMIFSEAMKRYREEIVQLSQVEVAKRLNISKQLLNKYENGRSQFPDDILRKLVHLYQLSPIDLYNIISGSAYPDDDPKHAMVLREKFEDEELERAVNMLTEHPDLKRLLTSASYYDKKKQEKFFQRLITLAKAIED